MTHPVGQPHFIVDDDEGGRKSLCYLIESIGIDVETYGSPLEFLDKFDGGRPGCLVLDVRMPQMGGLELLKTLRERGIDTPAIMISAFGDVRMAINAMKNGAVDFLTKPFNDQELLDRNVRRAVSAATWSFALRDGLSNSPQAPLGHGAAQPRQDRWTAQEPC